MNTEVKNVIIATDGKAQYDTSAKRLLAQKNILAHILVRTVDEFKEMKPEEVVSYIEGEPKIGTVPIEPWFCLKIFKMLHNRITCGRSHRRTHIH